MKKRIIGLITFLAMLTSVISAGAYYKPGGVSLTLSKSDVTASQGVEISKNGKLTVTGSGGEIDYDLYISFPINRLEMNYSAENNVSVCLEVDSVPYEFVLSKDETLRMYDFKSTIHEGDHIIRLSFDSAVTMDSLTVHEAPMSSHPNYNADLPAFTDAEYAVHSAVIIHEAASAIMVNGATRYINNADIEEKPVYIDGNLCLPIHTLSRALGYYYEDNPELSYTLMRYNKDEYVVKDGVKSKETDFRTEAAADFPIYYQNGQTYAGVRYFAEAIGKTVTYTNGFVIIDSRNIVKDILNSTAAMSYVDEVLSEFKEQTAAGSTYYVAQSFNASDDNPGTITAPFKTLNKAGDVAKAGDTVIVREGTYREIFTPKNDGTATSPITFKAAEGEKVVISATEVIDDFGALPDGKVVATLPVDMGYGFNQIFNKNDAITEARYPNGPAFEVAEGDDPLSPLFAINGDFKVNDNDATLVESETLLNQEEKDVWKGAYYISAHGQGYCLCQAKVESSEKGKLHLTDYSTRYWFKPDFDYLLDFGYLQGTEACMDLPGEWITRAGSLIMIPPEGETADSLVVEAKTRKFVADLDGRRYIHIKGISTFGGSISMEDSEMCMLDNMDIKYISHYTWNDDNDSGYIYDYTLRDKPEGQDQRKEVGIFVGGRNNIIINNNIAYSAGSGLTLCGLYAYVENNFIDSCGYAGAYQAGIWAPLDLSKDPTYPTGGFAIYENTLRRAGRGLFSATSPSALTKYDQSRAMLVPYEIAYNDFHDAIMYSIDAGITYTYGLRACTDRLYTKYHHNYAYYTLPYPNRYSFGIYHDGGSEGSLVYENVAFTTLEETGFTSGGIFTHANGSPNHLYNNMDLKAPVAGPEALETTQFPNNKPFYAGLRDNRSAFMKNYKEQQEQFIRLTSEDAEPSDTVTVLENGTLKFSETGAYLEFKDVDFGEEGYTHAVIYFTGDRNKLVASQFNIRTGDTFETATKNLFALTGKANSLTDLTNVSGNIVKAVGKTNVYLDFDLLTDPAMTIDSIVFDNFATATNGHDGSLIYGGVYDLLDAIGAPSMPPVRNTEKGHNDTPFVSWTWPGTKLRWKSVRVPENANVFYVAVASSAQYAGQEVIFEYNIEGAAGKKEIARMYVPDNKWHNDQDVFYFTLDEPITDDVIDIYVSFEAKADGDTNGSSQLFRFGFLESIPEGE